jgi:uncharacterized protein YbaA (DUF1428 family)
MYVDGFVFALPKKNLESYKAMATQAGSIWKKYGALQYVESLGDDMTPPGGELFFPALMNASDDEVIGFAFITYESRAHRDQVNAKVMADPAMNDMFKDRPMPFTMDRMATGGFEAIVSL